MSEGTEKVLGVDAALEFPAASKILFVPTPIVMVFPVFDVHSKVYTDAFATRKVQNNTAKAILDCSRVAHIIAHLFC